MMKFTVAEIIKRGVAEENIWVSYERKMFIEYWKSMTEQLKQSGKIVCL